MASTIAALLQQHLSRYLQAINLQLQVQNHQQTEFERRLLQLEMKSASATRPSKRQRDLAKQLDPTKAVLIGAQQQCTDAIQRAGVGELASGSATIGKRAGHPSIGQTDFGPVKNKSQSLNKGSSACGASVSAAAVFQIRNKAVGPPSGGSGRTQQVNTLVKEGTASDGIGFEHRVWSASEGQDQVDRAIGCESESTDEAITWGKVENSRLATCSVSVQTGDCGHETKLIQLQKEVRHLRQENLTMAMELQSLRAERERARADKTEVQANVNHVSQGGSQGASEEWARLPDNMAHASAASATDGIEVHRSAMCPAACGMTQGLGIAAVEHDNCCVDNEAWSSAYYYSPRTGLAMQFVSTDHLMAPTALVDSSAVANPRALLQAAQAGDEATCLSLLEQDSPRLLNEIDEFGWTVLHHLIASRLTTAARQLLMKSGFSQINAKTPSGESALHFAMASSGEICRLILERHDFRHSDDAVHNFSTASAGMLQCQSGDYQMAQVIDANAHQPWLGH